jgi:hypothetical protein
MDKLLGVADNAGVRGKTRQLASFWLFWQDLQNPAFSIDFKRLSGFQGGVEQSVDILPQLRSGYSHHKPPFFLKFSPSDRYNAP